MRGELEKTKNENLCINRTTEMHQTCIIIVS